jgi:hypothetical protein
MEAPIPELQEAIRKMHGYESRYLETVAVHEKLKNETVWQGEVQVFELVGHPKVTRCYAWSFFNQDSLKRRFIAVLGDGPVTSPVRAVQAYILAGYKSGEIK